MNRPFVQQTITLSCGKLTTGVTVKPWTGIFMLRNIKSPESYFQAAFRVQSPWEITTENGKKEIAKPECYICDSYSGYSYGSSKRILLTPFDLMIFCFQLDCRLSFLQTNTAKSIIPKVRNEVNTIPSHD